MGKLLLNPQLEKQIEAIMDKSNNEYDEGDYLTSIQTLEEAWAKLPEPKADYSESYHIAIGISETCILVKEYEKAKTWSEKLYECALHRIDSGEREFVSGKIAYESGEMGMAKEYFRIANKKSDGRCFEDEDKKYYKFFRQKLSN